MIKKSFIVFELLERMIFVKVLSQRTR